jgi:hypothetical protein
MTLKAKIYCNFRAFVPKFMIPKIQSALFMQSVSCLPCGLICGVCGSGIGSVRTFDLRQFLLKFDFLFEYNKPQFEDTFFLAKWGHHNFCI